MKKTLLSAAIFFSLGCIVSACSSDKDDRPDPGKLEVAVFGDIQIDKNGGSRTVPVLTHSDWEASSTAEWLTLTYGDNVLVLSAGINSSGQDRSTEVTVSLLDHGKSSSFTVVQPLRPEVILLIEPDRLEAGFQGGDYTLQIGNPKGIEWTWEITDQPDWITEKDSDTGSLTLTLSPNEADTRTAEIVFSDTDGNVGTVVPVVQTGMEGYDQDDPTTYGYTLMMEMQADASLVGQDWNAVDAYMKQHMLEYTEHPSREAHYPHSDGEHIEVVWDADLGQYVYNFMVHVEEDICGDGATLADRQRNEMKSRVHSSNKIAYKDVNGNYDEWQIIEWKMKIPAGFMPSTSFTHIHQLKGQEGSNIGSPVITLTLRRNSGNSRLQVIHTGRSTETTLGTFLDNIPLSELEDQWVQVQQEAHFHRNGYYRLKITRLSDGAVLADHEETDIDMWRVGGAVNIRNKFGIYRSFGKTLTDPSDRPTNGIKDENLWLGDFKFYEKNSNPDPQPVED